MAPTAVLVSWVDDSDNETGFVVEHRVATSPQWQSSAPAAQNTTAQVVTGLDPATTYEFRVVALNSGGRSASRALLATTPAAVSIDAVTPDSTTSDRVDPILLRGRGFTVTRPGQALEVQFAGVPAQQVTVVDDQNVAVTPPPGGTGDVTITLSNGYQDVAAPVLFTYFPARPRFSENDQRVNVNLVGQSASSDPKLVGSGRFVYSAWVDTRPGQESDIYFNYSTDGAATWSQNEIRLDTDPLANASSDVEMACSGANVYVCWEDARDGFRDIRLNRSLDHGVTWLAQDVRLDSGPAGSAASQDPEICASGDHVFVTWFDARNGHQDIFLNASHDRGSTWLQSDVRVSDPTDGRRSDPVICCDGSAVCVAWADQRSGVYDIYFDRSLDGGVTWLPQDVQLDTGPQSTADSLRVQLCMEGQRVIAVWHDDLARSGGARDIYANVSTDGGATWLAAARRLDDGAPGAIASTNPQVACSGQQVYVVWSEAGPAGSQYTVAVSSRDGGVSWTAPQRIDRATTSSVATAATLGCSGRRCYVTWADTRNAPGGGGTPARADIYFADTDDGGITWHADQRIDRDPAGFANSDAPRLVVDGARVTIAWLDARYGSSVLAIFSNRRLP